MKKTLLTATVAGIALLMAMPNTVNAETVHTETHIQPQEIEGVNAIQFSEFDLNNDGIYSKDEVGEKLFYIFDQDGNEVIDNLEWEDRNVYTITPMEKETFRYVDYDDDGMAEQASYTYEEFYKFSGLIRFDEDNDGLSAAEFIDTGFLALDTDDSTTIEMDEWKDAYSKMVKPESAEQERYN